MAAGKFRIFAGALRCHLFLPLGRFLPVLKAGTAGADPPIVGLLPASALCAPLILSRLQTACPRSHPPLGHAPDWLQSDLSSPEDTRYSLQAHLHRPPVFLPARSLLSLSGQDLYPYSFFSAEPPACLPASVLKACPPSRAQPPQAPF